VLTTPAGAKRLGGNAKGLARWETTTLSGPDGVLVTVTATPARHGPPGADLTAGPVTGFALAWEGQAHGVLYLSVLFGGIREVAQRFPAIAVAVLNIGAARFAASGPMRYTFDAAEAAKAWAVLKARTVVPSHYGGFTHFKEGAAAARPILEAAGVPALWVDPGVTVDLEV
jgi:L-ascorbate metabolism protein UlaG (beta-lactamase superfamily)